MQELIRLKPYSPAEEKLLSGSALGERTIIGDGTVPNADTPDVSIRADLIRELLLSTNSQAPLHEKGIRLRGARITGRLDLQGVDCSHDLTLTQCYLEKPPSFLNARIRGLHLSGSTCPGLIADNAQFEGSVFLRRGFISTGEISMPGARISGDLQICDARLSSDQPACVFAASIRVEGSVFLGDYPYDDAESELHSKGALIFSSAKVAQDFYIKNCAITPEGGKFKNPLFLDGEESGSLTALSLARAEIGGVLFSKKNQISGGAVNLSGAQTRRLNDEPVGDTAGYPIRLNGFTYQDFSEEADTHVNARLDWLERRPSLMEFSAQPYEQLARVLNEIGHREDARTVLMRKERLQRASQRDLIRASKVRLWRLPMLAIVDRVLRWMIGYGYQPAYAVVWAVVLIGGLAMFFQKTWDAGDFAPNAPPVLISKDWISATQTHPENPAVFWSDPNQAGKDYETFNSIAYAADLVIPIVNLGQEAAWAPSTSRSWWGRQGWWMRWFAKAIGWVLTALAAAAVTGVIRRD